MKNCLIIFFLSSFLYTQSDQMSANDIMKAIDKNLNANSRVITSKMVIKGRRNSRTIESKNWIVGTELAFTEYLSPPREAGTKMLKIGEKLYTYSPQTDRVIQISGHMLRQSVMGSDMSYNDMMEDRPIEQLYKATLEGSIKIDDRDHYIIALDAKVNFDSSGLFRHKNIEELRDTNEEEPLETRANAVGLNYIKLDGEIGCMVNGAGLAMATMDIIKLHGGEPANFLDVGGGADSKQVAEGFKVILSDPEVKAIFVNIFGGIMRCDFIAEGIIEAAKEIDMKIPLVVRLAGTNVELGKKMLSESGLDLIAAEDMDDGARKAITAIGGKT